MNANQLRKIVLNSTNLTKPMKKFAKQATNGLLEECIYNANVQKPYFEMTLRANNPALKNEVCKQFYDHMTMQFSQIYGGQDAGQCATAFVTIAMENDLTDYFYGHISYVSLEFKNK